MTASRPHTGHLDAELDRPEELTDERLVAIAHECLQRWEGFPTIPGSRRWSVNGKTALRELSRRRSGLEEQFEAACVERDRISREGVGAVLKWSERAERAEAALREIADLDSQRVQFAAVGGEGGVMRKIAREALNPMQDSA